MSLTTLCINTLPVPDTHASTTHNTYYMTVPALRMVHYPNHSRWCTAALQSVNMAERLKPDLGVFFLCSVSLLVRYFGWWTAVNLAVALSDSKIPVTPALHTVPWHIPVSVSLIYSEQSTTQIYALISLIEELCVEIAQQQVRYSLDYCTALLPGLPTNNNKPTNHNLCKMKQQEY